MKYFFGMKYRIIIIFITFVFTGCVQIYNHSPGLATCTASSFLNALAVQKSVAKAYQYADDALKSVFPESKVAPFLLRMHPDTFPRSLKASFFELIPGSNLINIYFSGTNQNESFNYRVQMIGETSKGYKVFAFFRNTNSPKASGSILTANEFKCGSEN
jgi:hypothetical protein